MRIQVDVSNVKPVVDGGGGWLGTGYYLFKIVACKDAQAKTGRDQHSLTLECDEGKAFTYVNCPREGDKPRMLSGYRAFLEAMEYSEADLSQGAIEVDSDEFVGRYLYAFYKEGDKAAGIYSEVTPLPPAVWEADKAEGKRLEATQEAAAPAPAPQVVIPPPPRVTAPPVAPPAPPVVTPPANNNRPVPPPRPPGPPAGGLRNLNK